MGSGRLLADPVIAEIVAANGKSSAQIMLRWHLQQGVVAIPRSSNPDRIRENIALTDFSLSSDEMMRLSALGTSGNRIFDPDFVAGWD